MRYETNNVPAMTPTRGKIWDRDNRCDIVVNEKESLVPLLKSRLLQPSRLLVRIRTEKQGGAQCKQLTTPLF